MNTRGPVALLGISESTPAGCFFFCFSHYYLLIVIYAITEIELSERCIPRVIEASPKTYV